MIQPSYPCAWSSLVEGGEGLYLPNCQTNLAIALYALILFFKFINTTAYHLGGYKPPSPVSCNAPCLLLNSSVAYPYLQLLVERLRFGEYGGLRQPVVRPLAHGQTCPKAFLNEDVVVPHFGLFDSLPEFAKNKIVSAFKLGNLKLRHFLFCQTVFPWSI